MIADDDSIYPMQDYFHRKPAADSDAHTAEIPLVAPGMRLKDRYDVLAHIGSGGMANVYEAWDVLFERAVAIKVLKRERISDMMKARVLREAKASCAVDHPHMLRVTDMGYIHGAPYLVTDLLRGASLGEVLRQEGGRLDWRRVVAWMLPAMEALHMAHEAGLVHRDLKPENLFLHHRGDREVLVVLDLGIVKLIDLARKPTRWTQSGMILGTAAYMSPEQASGATIDRRADIYALGVTLYRLISGRHLFPSDTRDGPLVPMTRHMYEPPPRLDDPALPPALVDAIHVALTKDPAGRHPSMAWFAERLAACLVSAPQTSPALRRGHAARLGVSLGLGAVFVLAVQQIAPSQVAPSRPDPVAIPAISAAPDDGPRDVCEPKQDLDEAPTVASADEVELTAAPPPAPLVSPVRSPPTRTTSPRPLLPDPTPPPDADTLLQATDAIRRCMQMHGSIETRALRVRVVVRQDGRVQTASLGDGEPDFLDECAYDRLTRLRFAAGARRTLEHTYTRAAETAR